MKNKNKLISLLIAAVLGFLATGKWPQLPEAVSAVLSVLTGKHAPAAGAPAHSVYDGTVVAVHDGDTIRVRDGNGAVHKIRLANIDAPEIAQRDGTASRDHLRAQIFAQNVEIRVVDRDRYGREVGTVWQHDRDINLFQVAQGFAWHYASIAKRQQNSADFARYESAQAAARRNRLGLWHNPRAVPPWRFRHQERRPDNASGTFSLP